jgi:hypothetical protein
MSEWQDAKNIFWDISFPSDVLNAREIPGTHVTKGGTHNIKGYVLIGKIRSFDWYSQYSFCPECNAVITKNMQLFNQQSGFCVDRSLMKRGKAVDN